MYILSTFILLFAHLAFGQGPKMPPHFYAQGKKIVFINIIKANYTIQYNVKSKTASVQSTLFFNISEKGYPAFDLVPKASAYLESEPINILSIRDPHDQSKFKFFNKELSSGHYTITLYSKITENIKFERESVSSAFWMSDLASRKYLEQYLPTSFEYDQIQMEFTLKIIGTNKEHELFTNGKLTKIKKNLFQVKYPDYFTSSSIYFHLIPKNKYPSVQFSYQSISGTTFPITIYAKKDSHLKKMKLKTLKILPTLEKDFGPWGHPSLIIYNSGYGGMEYSGATITSSSALAHELTHSYFARGVMPVNGNSGWIDEAIASWRDLRKPTLERPNFQGSNMGNHSPYKRSTDTMAYVEGASFMSYLNFKLQDQGGLGIFLKQAYSLWLHQSITTQDFLLRLNSFGPYNFSDDFDRYIFGKKGITPPPSKRENPYHPRLTKEQLIKLL